MMPGRPQQEDPLNAPDSPALSVQDLDPDTVLARGEARQVEVELGREVLSRDSRRHLIVQAHRHKPTLREQRIRLDNDGLLTGPFPGQVCPDAHVAGGEMQNRTRPMAAAPIESPGRPPE